jgi:hypothetical protein
MDYRAHRYGISRPRRYRYYTSLGFDSSDHWSPSPSPPNFSHESADEFLARGKRFRQKNAYNMGNFGSRMSFPSGMPSTHRPYTHRRAPQYVYGGHPTWSRPSSRPDVEYIDPNTYRGRSSARERQTQPRCHSYERRRPVDGPDIIEREPKGAPKPQKGIRVAEPSTTPQERQARSRSPVEERRPPRAGRRTPSGYSTGSGIPERERMPYNRTPGSPHAVVGERQRRPYPGTPCSP